MSRHHHRFANRARWQHLRRLVLDRDGWRCRSCGRPGRLEVDHIVPLDRGGAIYDLSNLQTLCAFPCHAEKTSSENRLPPTPAEAAWQEMIAAVVRRE